MTDQAYKSMSGKLNMSFAHIGPNLWHNYVGRLRKPKIKDVELAYPENQVSRVFLVPDPSLVKYIISHGTHVFLQRLLIPLK